MATIEQMAAVLAQLRTTGLTAVFDGEATYTPPGPYASVYDDPGLGQATRYAQTGGTTRIGWSFRVVCASRTTDGVRAAVAMTREALDQFRPDPSRAASWLSQTTAGPMLPDGPEGDRRHSQTLVYSLVAARS